MKFFIEKNKKNTDRVTINIPKKIVSNELIREFIEINKKTKINGFRKGKTPIKIIQEKYGNRVYYDVFNQLMQKFFYEFIKKEKIKIIGLPKYVMHENEDQKEYFKYSVNYEVYPKFEIKDVNLIKVEKIIVNIKDEDVKKNIEKTASYEKDIWNKVNRAIKTNDLVTINYCIYENNKKLDKFNVEKFKFIVSQNNFIPELNNKLINHFTNDVIFFKINFCKFHPEEELQGKDITFKIKILNVEEKQENIEIEKNIKTIKINKLSKLNYQTIKNNIIEKIKSLTQNHLQNQIIKQLIIKNPINIPPTLLREETNFLRNKFIKEYKEKQENILKKKYHTNLESKAKTRLHIKLIIEKIIRDNKISVNEEKVDLLIKKISLKYKKPLEIINIYKKNTMLRKTIKNIELEMQVMQFLIKKVKIIEKNWTLDEIMNYNWKNNEELFA
ncbi:trigger factor [Buchnera aphidicola]|uniref:Trigger factor n=1 Tax=Buchnera aphidicola subsp. Schizaphis graminum (strain Sg) TaxID=198804 RepID=TIG_BUCAP|nr:trigger factor [Buchnera aphidicola]Q8K991.1 RecName: Full=Trigger factor; Short=TF; AltName: Full=PPIase [Buchnera aphidicola str. Sg (Schizaphis graminum)]AAM68001.1 trigger factor (TF) [Buchnera aphidicola str. Sg (Schizaphis graminum)]